LKRFASLGTVVAFSIYIIVGIIAAFNGDSFILVLLGCYSLFVLLPSFLERTWNKIKDPKSN